jgi:cytochrome bd-type quinol oxidase subunit 2
MLYNIGINILFQKMKKNNLAKIFSGMTSVFFVAFAGGQTALGQWDKGRYDQTQLPKAPITDIVTNVAKWILAIFGFVAVMGFVISGIIYLLAAGDEDAQKRAKRAMIYSITGVMVGLAGLVVIYAADSFLRANSTTSGSSIINNAANSPATGATP